MTLSDLIYLDYNASTPLDAEVCHCMQPFFAGQFGNPSSQHRLGRMAKDALEDARERVALCLGASQDEIIFTSSATEANNLAVFGIAQGNGIALSRGEHPSLHFCALELERRGVPVCTMDINADASLCMDSFRVALEKRPDLVSVNYCNHEVGTVNDVASIAAACHDAAVLFHCDAVQAAGRVSIDTHALGMDLMTLSGHKIYGPRGVGVLFLRRGTALSSHILGGSQERSHRAGTENVAAAVGFAKALELVEARREKEAARLFLLKQRLWQGLACLGENCFLNGRFEEALSNTLNVSFLGVRNELLLMKLDLNGIAVSTGSACASGATEPSVILEAMGLAAERRQSAIRFSMGRFTNEDEVDRCLKVLGEALGSLEKSG